MKQRTIYLTLATISGLAFTALFTVAMAQSAAGAIAGSESQSGAISGAQAGAVSVNNPTGLGVSSANNRISFDNHSVSKGSDLSRMVPQVYTPALTNSVTDVCFGSGSGGITGPGFGASFAKTYMDNDCVARLHSRELSSRAVQMNQAGATELGLVLLTASFEVLCSRPMIFQAMQRTSKIAGKASICAGQDPDATDYDPLALQVDKELQEDTLAWFPTETNEEFAYNTKHQVWGGQYRDTQTSR